MGESIAEAQDCLKKPRVYTVEKLKNLKSDDLKDTDIIDVSGKRLIVVEAKTLIQRELHVGDQKILKRLHRVCSSSIRETKAYLIASHNPRLLISHLEKSVSCYFRQAISLLMDTQ